MFQNSADTNEMYQLCRTVSQSNRGRKLIRSGGTSESQGVGYSDILARTIFWVQNSEFQYFWGFEKYFLGGMKIFWIFFGVITKFG